MKAKVYEFPEHDRLAQMAEMQRMTDEEPVPRSYRKPHLFQSPADPVLRIGVALILAMFLILYLMPGSPR